MADILKNVLGGKQDAAKVDPGKQFDSLTV